MKPIVVIPAYNPDKRLLLLVREIKKLFAPDIVVVDDGSCSARIGIFDLLSYEHNCIVLKHDRNRGKGAALKTAAQAVAERFPGRGYVTADADGQHLPEDIRRIALVLEEHPNALVIGTRDFSEPGVPAKSFGGNRFTSFLFKLRTGLYLPDTQTGLRGIPASFVQNSANAKGSRFDYEMNMLLYVAENGMEILQIPIGTVYDDGNRGSHFRVLSDSVRIGWVLLKFAFSSLGCSALDVGIFTLLCAFIFNTNALGILFATMSARILSGICNYLINRNMVFGVKRNVGCSASGYFALFLVLMIASGSATGAFTEIGLQPTFAKIIVDTALFSISYFIQRNFIFSSRPDRFGVTKRITQFFRRPYRWAVVFSVCLALFFYYAILDAFVIPKPMQDVYAGQMDSDVSAKAEGDVSVGAIYTTEPGIAISETEEYSANQSEDDSSYTDENISITIETFRAYDTDVYVADIKIKDVTYLKTALADDQFGRNIKETTSQMAAGHSAILAINGDYYGFRDDSAVLRNGVNFRSGSDGRALILSTDGAMHCMNEAEITDDVVDTAWQVWSFGPALIEGGEIAVDASEEVSGRSSRSNPRTAIGWAGDLHYVMIVSGGRTDNNAGLSLYELAQVMEDYGCKTAYNLDGGGSSCMVWKGSVLNDPTTSGKKGGEREVSDIVYIGYE
jgi:exopolysaccharide biosynthesis protein